MVSLCPLPSGLEPGGLSKTGSQVLQQPKPSSAALPGPEEEEEMEGLVCTPAVPPLGGSILGLCPGVCLIPLLPPCPNFFRGKSLKLCPVFAHSPLGRGV